MMRPSPSELLALDLALDELLDARPQADRRDQQPAVAALARDAGEDVEEVGHVGADLVVAGQHAQVDVEARRLVVVVAGADVDVAPQPAALAADDERRLGVGLEADQAVGDVGAGALQRAGPDDVGPLVEAGLDLDHDDDLLAALGGLDERPDDGRVAARAVERHLDGQHVGVAGRLLDEALHGADERLVGVVDEQVAGADGGEDVGLLVLVVRQQPRRDDRVPGLALELGDVEVGDRLQRAQVEHAGDLVDVLGLEAQAALQERARLGRHRALDLEPHDLAEAAPAELLLDGQQQVVRLVLLDGEVGVAGHPEEVVLDDLHAREERVQVGGDDLLQQHVGAHADLHQARQDRGHLDAREVALAGLRVAHGHRQRERQVADVREGMAGVDRQRRQDREDLVHEPPPQLELALRSLVVADDADALRRPAPRAP